MSRDNILNVLEESVEKREGFFKAWKRGVEFLGEDLFGPDNLKTARDKDGLTPLPAAVEKAFARASGGEEQFLAAMVSFFDPTWGAELAGKIECDKSVCGLTYNLDHARIEVLCELLRNYQGWPSSHPEGASAASGKVI